MFCLKNLFSSLIKVKAAAKASPVGVFPPELVLRAMRKHLSNPEVLPPPPPPPPLPPPLEAHGTVESSVESSNREQCAERSSGQGRAASGDQYAAVG